LTYFSGKLGAKTGHYTTPLLDFYGRSRRVRANDLSETVKLVILANFHHVSVDLLEEAFHERWTTRRAKGGLSEKKPM